MEKQSTIEQLETEVDEGIRAFVRLGRALIQICDRQLYRDAGFSNLEAYTLARWGYRRAWAYKLMDAARVYGYLEDAGLPKNQLPTSESTIRDLAKLSPEECVEIWKQALERCSKSGLRPSPKPTKALITELVTNA